MRRNVDEEKIRFMMFTDILCGVLQKSISRVVTRGNCEDRGCHIFWKDIYLLVRSKCGWFCGGGRLTILVEVQLPTIFEVEHRASRQDFVKTVVV